MCAPVMVPPARLSVLQPDAAQRRSRAAAYVALTKPRIIELLLVTTVPTIIVAERGLPSPWLVFATVLGGAAAAGGANAINMVVDRDIDAVMHRTRNRPLVTGVVGPREEVEGLWQHLDGHSVCRPTTDPAVHPRAAAVHRPAIASPAS